MEYTIENLVGAKIGITTETPEESLKVHYLIHLAGIEWCLSGGSIMEFPRYCDGPDTVVSLTKERQLSNNTRKWVEQGIAGIDRWYEGWQLISAQQFIDANVGDVDLDNIPEFGYENKSSQEYREL